MKKFLLALLVVGLLAMPAVASVQNVKVSGDIESTWVVRDQFDLGDVTKTEMFYQNFLLTQTRLRVDADLTDNVQATVGLINERVWGADANSITGDPTSLDTSGASVSVNDFGSNDIDLNLAYVTLKEMLYSPLTVIIGRQSFAFGNSFVMDSAGSNNSVSTGGLKGVAEDFTKRTALDSIRAILDYNPLTINVIASKVDANNVGGTGAHDDDVDLFGTNVAYQLGDKWQTLVEGYFWSKIDQSTKTGGVGRKADTIHVPGVHVSTNPIKGLNVSAEVAFQRGNKATTSSGGDNVSREAQAVQLITNYALPFAKTEKYKPVVMGAYTYVSGDSNPSEAARLNNKSEDTYTAWDPFFENQSGGKIYNTLFNLSNAHIITTKASVKPLEDVTASVEWDVLWLDKEIYNGTGVGNCGGSGPSCSPSAYATLQPDGSTASSRVTTNQKIGDEIGLGLVYDYTEDVRLGAKFNWFVPGGLFHSDNDDVASQVLVNANVNF